ncbi:hypothetical protein [Variovorax sp. dw_308]|uniref:hypothetical protein n=1 Tax=Variovorax sp. dw_308 TaxID=2721546 RepID=UPI001C466FA2|nr:hypothetical protein [Variovorax sp. dw_308]
MRRCVGGVVTRRVVCGVTHAMRSRGVGVMARCVVWRMAYAVAGPLGCAVAAVTAS